MTSFKYIKNIKINLIKENYLIKNIIYLTIFSIVIAIFDFINNNYSIDIIIILLLTGLIYFTYELYKTKNNIK